MKIQSASEEKLPYAIDIMLLGECNLQCPFCWGPDHKIPAMATHDLFSVINLLHKHGTKAIVFSGGEPTLIRDLPQILERSKGLGIQTILSTNGILFARRIEEIAPSLDWIALPIDASNPNINRELRKGHPDQMGKVMQIIPKLREKFPDVKIKLGTVATRVNREYIHDILLHLPKEMHPDVWKLYQIHPTRYGKENYGWLSIDDKDFAAIEEKARKTAREVGVQIYVSRNAEQEGQHFLVHPNGDVKEAEETDGKTVGNIIAEPKTIFPQWQKFIHETRLEENLHSTYPDPAREPNQNTSDFCLERSLPCAGRYRGSRIFARRATSLLKR